MTWQTTWQSLFDAEPPMPASREESVQDALTKLIAGRDCDWFRTYIPTPRGREFLALLWLRAFDDPIGRPEWFVSEYDMPVPDEWRSDINYSYRCVDLACGDQQHLAIFELKTERQSYRADQIRDYLRLVGRRNPGHRTDVVLLGPYRPGYSPLVGDEQRYTELTWSDVRPLLAMAFPDDPLARALSAFLADQFPATQGDEPTSMLGAPGEQSSRADQTPLPDDEIDTAVTHALRMAPAVATAIKGDATERGIDVRFADEAGARTAQQRIKAALSDSGWDDRVSVWLWKATSSGGQALTAAGFDTGFELRLAPVGIDRHKKGSLVG